MLDVALWLWLWLWLWLLLLLLLLLAAAYEPCLEFQTLGSSIFRLPFGQRFTLGCWRPWKTKAPRRWMRSAEKSMFGILDAGWLPWEWVWYMLHKMNWDLARITGDYHQLVLISWCCSFEFFNWQAKSKKHDILPWQEQVQYAKFEQFCEATLVEKGAPERVPLQYIAYIFLTCSFQKMLTLAIFLDSFFDSYSISH